MLGCRCIPILAFRDIDGHFLVKRSLFELSKFSRLMQCLRACAFLLILRSIIMHLRGVGISCIGGYVHGHFIERCGIVKRVGVAVVGLLFSLGNEEFLLWCWTAIISSALGSHEFKAVFSVI